MREEEGDRGRGIESENKGDGASQPTSPDVGVSLSLSGWLLPSAINRYRHNWLISGNHRGNQEVRQTASEQYPIFALYRQDVTLPLKGSPHQTGATRF